jgi:uncharacterized membrane protein
MPKYFFVSLIIGGLFAILIASIASRVAATDQQTQFALAMIRAVFRYQVVPATAGAVLFGILLLLQHPREFLSMRWMRVKLALVIIAVPSAHLVTSTAVRRLAGTEHPQTSLVPILSASLVVFIAIALLGRLKPRLNQPYRRP